MERTVSRKRPWLAALLAALATGLGHLYLRRWRRGFGWLALLFAVTGLFVDPAALEALANRQTVDPMALAPVFIVGGFSVVDAYILAHTQNATARLPGGSDEQRPRCPSCGNELDPELEFCHWCTTEIERPEGTTESERPAAAPPPEGGERDDS